MARSWSWTLCLVLLASMLILCSALPPPPPPGRGSTTVPTTSADEAILARVCDPRGPRPAWCGEPHLRQRFLRALARHRHARHHHQHQHRAPVPLPPPGRYDGDEIDPRYGVSKRRVPTGPNPLHN